MTREQKLRHLIIITRELKETLEERLENHMGGDDCERYKRCHFEKDGYTKREYYNLECKAGNKLYDRVERQGKRLAKLKALQEKNVQVTAL